MTQRVPLPTLLARARRNKRPLIFFHVRSLDEVAAVVEASETTRKAAAIVIDTTEPLPYSLSSFVALAGELIGRSSSAISLAVAVHANHHSINQALSLGIETIIPIRHSESKEQYAALVAWTLRSTATTSQQVILDLGAQHDEVLFFASLGLHDIAAARVNVLSNRSERPRMRGAVLDEISATLRLPLIASSSLSVHSRTAKTSRLRISGTEDRRGLSEAYTAGLRAALHDRTLCDTARYSGKARKAAVNYAISQIEQICTTS